ncbi:MAG: CPBP family intramembrane metalloprotease [Rhodoluna sp.]|nr:CPBP family intramembrane metalloprotease [Rhodoluna sp.]
MRLRLELAIVFALSLGKSAAYSVVALIAALTSPKGLGGSSVTINESLSSRPWLDVTYQLLGTGFSLVPVALCLFLLSAYGNPFARIGFGARPIYKNVWQGFALAAVIGLPGLALYFGARQLGLSAQIVTSDLGADWWTIPVLLFSAIGAALLEEVVVVGYLFDRLQKLGRGRWPTIFISAAIRGSYHLYQGFGGFIGNFAMGIVFGWAYRKFGRLTPLVIAHFILDAISFLGYAWAKTFIGWL